MAVSVQLLVTRDTPDVCRHIVLFSKKLLRLQGFVDDGAACQKLGMQFGFRVVCGLEFIQTFQDPFLDFFDIGNRGYGVVSFISVM